MLRYGALRTESGSRVTPYLFTDQELDAETGLYYFGARYYDPILGRFTSPDALVPRLYDPQSLNGYAYARNDPMNRTDPSGYDDGTCPAGATACTSLDPGLPSSSTPYDPFPVLPPLMEVPAGGGVYLYSGPFFRPASTAPPAASVPASDFVSHAGLSMIGGYRTMMDAGYTSDPLTSTIGGSREFAFGLLQYAMIALPLAAEAAPLDLAVVGRTTSTMATGGEARAYSTAFEARLSPTSYPGVSRAGHFQEANEQLLRAMATNPEFAAQMRGLGINLERSVTGLAPRTPPLGWTWHHEVQPGVIRLVPRVQHAPGSPFWKVLHPGGRGGYSIWGQ